MAILVTVYADLEKSRQLLSWETTKNLGDMCRDF